eukprot:CAMPEP_0168333674 /NCGR_PEP_ID=MMETSP0213-20121227/9757_1 /TAXON_ID=151035 /ORGANISM="Euplotes harpa, Strain FSP1.4" /LENGTH=139 /DNA_ID=CAMNT_0008338061 /DNA_START=141 /DNA_END=560 /DNA_ORIENTATION=-
MATFSVANYEMEGADRRNQYHEENKDKFAKMEGQGLNMAKKRNNFKEIQKAAERMKQKAKQIADKRRQQREEKRELIAQKEWKINSKEQINKEKRRSERLFKKEERLKEKELRKSLLQEEEQNFEMAKSQKNKKFHHLQ